MWNRKRIEILEKKVDGLEDLVSTLTLAYQKLSDMHTELLEVLLKKPSGQKSEYSSKNRS